MKKLVIILSLIFVAGIISASAQSSVSSDKQTTKTEIGKGDDGVKAKGCCAKSIPGCKAGSMKCCSKDKAEKSSKGCADKSEAVISESKEPVTGKSK